MPYNRFERLPGLGIPSCHHVVMSSCRHVVSHFVVVVIRVVNRMLGKFIHPQGYVKNKIGKTMKKETGKECDGSETREKGK